jgi:hypothetical protein
VFWRHFVTFPLETQIKSLQMKISFIISNDLFLSSQNSLNFPCGMIMVRRKFSWLTLLTLLHRQKSWEPIPPLSIRTPSVLWLWFLQNVFIPFQSTNLNFRSSKFKTQIQYWLYPILDLACYTNVCLYVQTLCITYKTKPIASKTEDFQNQLLQNPNKPASILQNQWFFFWYEYKPVILNLMAT